MKRKSILIPLPLWRQGERYSIAEDALVFGKWQFCIRLSFCSPLIVWGWRFEERQE